MSMEPETETAEGEVYDVAEGDPPSFDDEPQTKDEEFVEPAEFLEPAGADDDEAMDYPDQMAGDYEDPEYEAETESGGGGGGGGDAIPFTGRDLDGARRPSVGQKIGTGFKKTGKWIKGAGIRFGHKVKNEDWGGEIKRGGSATGKAVKESFVGMGNGLKKLGNKEDRSAMWSKTKAAWAKQWRLAKKGLKKAVDNIKDKEKRQQMFAGMKRSTATTFKAAGQQMKGYKAEMNKTSKANLDRADGIPSTNEPVVRPPPSAQEKYAPAATGGGGMTSSPSASYVAEADPDLTAPLEEDNEYDPAAGTGAKSKFQAMYNYDAGNEDELSLTKGETISAYPAEEIGWLYATNEEGVTGLIPANYVGES